MTTEQRGGGGNSRPCPKCGHELVVANIKWGRDTSASAWFIHESTGTPVCPNRPQEGKA